MMRGVDMKNVRRILDRGYVMRDHHNGNSVFFIQIIDDFIKLGGDLGIKTRNRFVKEKHISRCAQSASEKNTLLLAAGKLTVASIGKLFDSQALHIGIRQPLFCFVIEAYDYTTVSVATLSYYFAPVIVTALCPILFREKLTGKQILCFVMSTVGLVLITGIGTVGEGRHMVGIAFGLGAAVFYASVVLMNKYIRDVDGVERTFWQFVGAAVVLLPYVLVTSGVNLHLLELTGWASLLVVGVFHTGICYCLYFSALKELPGQKAAILSYIDPLVAVLVSVALLQEPISGWQIAGGLLILGFTLYNEL